MVDDKQYYLKKGRDGTQSLGERSIPSELSNGVETENKRRQGGRFGNGENLKKQKKLITIAKNQNQFKRKDFSFNFYNETRRPGI